MPVLINETEARVLGSLVEKQLTTPEYYPLTLNALIAACNQKSNRGPVMSMDETVILGAIDSLREKNLVYTFHGSTSRTVKYKHMLPGVFELEPPGVAVITLLLLRGPQTIGELRGRSDRLYEFSGLGEVQETLDELAKREEPLVIKLERQPGQKEARYAHLLSGKVEADLKARPLDARIPPSHNEDDLSAEIKRIADDLAAFRMEFEEFKKQFE
ncbi:MAG TPA: YceH family protein [Pyrinomonadaceae bacterium]|nr:YceH family protein [Pyrinomonadaceae bacterium]